MDRARISGNVIAWDELCPPHLTFRVKMRAQRRVPEEKKPDNYTYTYVYISVGDRVKAPSKGY